MIIRSLSIPFIGALLLLGSAAVSAKAPTAFTATYRVTQGGMPLGDAKVILRDAGDGEWVYSKSVKGSGGMAAMLAANLEESSRFRWKGTVPEALSYDYALTSAIKSKQRHLRVDWAKKQVSVDDGKGPTSYPAAPGMVERNTLALAIGMALRGGSKSLSLPVAVKQQVETQNFKVTGREAVKVPAGSFDAERVERTDADRGFSAWYVPDRYPLPVKLSQHDGGNIEMELLSYHAD